MAPARGILASTTQSRPCATSARTARCPGLISESKHTCVARSHPKGERLLRVEITYPTRTVVRREMGAAGLRAAWAPLDGTAAAHLVRRVVMTALPDLDVFSRPTPWLAGDLNMTAWSSSPDSRLCCASSTRRRARLARR